jgi:hypothetical protein
MGGFTQDDGYRARRGADARRSSESFDDFYRFSGALLAEPNYL